MADLISRKVIVVIADDATNAALRAWAQEAGFNLGTDYEGDPRPVDAFDFHVTLVASANEVFVPETQHMIVPLTLEAAEFAELGKDRRVPVLGLARDARLAAMREFFIMTYGIEPTFADFKPHVSLSYSWDGAPDLEALEPPPFALTFNQLRVKTLGPKPPAKAARPRWPVKARTAGAHGLYR